MKARDFRWLVDFPCTTRKSQTSHKTYKDNTEIQRGFRELWWICWWGWGRCCCRWLWWWWQGDFHLTWWDERKRRRDSFHPCKLITILQSQELFVIVLRESLDVEIENSLRDTYSPESVLVPKPVLCMCLCLGAFSCSSSTKKKICAGAPFLSQLSAHSWREFV